MTSLQRKLSKLSNSPRTLMHSISNLGWKWVLLLSISMASLHLNAEVPSPTGRDGEKCSFTPDTILEVNRKLRASQICKSSGSADRCDRITNFILQEQIFGFVKKILYAQPPQRNNDQKIAVLKNWISSNSKRGSGDVTETRENEKNSSTTAAAQIKPSAPNPPIYPQSLGSLESWYKEILTSRPMIQDGQILPAGDPLFPDSSFPVVEWKDRLQKIYFENSNFQLARLSPQQLKSANLTPYLKKLSPLCSQVASLSAELGDSSTRAAPAKAAD